MNEYRFSGFCLPVADLQKTLHFYKRVFGFSDAQVDGYMVALELPNLTLILHQEANRRALMPGVSAPPVISCAVETKEDVDQSIGKADSHGGGFCRAAAIDTVSGGYIGTLLTQMITLGACMS